MIYLDLEAESLRLREAGEHGQLPLKKLDELRQQFQDLHGVLDQWGGLRLCSASRNGQMDSMEIVQSRDAGEAGVVEIWPYQVLPQGRLYADPPYVVVGHGNPQGFGVIPTEDWEFLLWKAGVPDTLIGKVKEYIRRHPPVNYDQVPDDARV